MAKKRKMTGVFCERKAAPKTAFDRRSFRTIRRGKNWLIVGCPRGKWDAKTDRCRVGTRAHKILVRTKKGSACRIGTRITKG